jgi:hypothetical protein
MELQELLSQIKSAETSLNFGDVIATIDANYVFTPTAFTNGAQQNAIGENSGSCKIFYFGKLHQLSEKQTLACFGDYYTRDVLLHPEQNDHQNIRQFIAQGWAGIAFNGAALLQK